jgi:hypothetical protein
MSVCIDCHEILFVSYLSNILLCGKMELSRVDVHTGGSGAVKKWTTVDRGGGGQKSGKLCGRHKWMTPNSIKYEAALTCQHHHSLKCLHSETGQATHDAAQVVRGSCGYQYR